jgi:SAM-dependent methyltransferase
VSIKQRLRQFINQRLVTPGFRPGALATISVLQHLSNLYPHKESENGFTLPAYADGGAREGAQSALPVPPELFRASYCSSAESFVQSGADDIATLRRLLSDSDFSIEDSGRILELGVAGGRMIRHLVDIAATNEIWGIDVWSSAVLWCKENLSPPFHFATTTVTPHVPFEDRSFGLVYAGSVWTHLDDLADAWALEVHRLLRPGGRLYFTINDRSAVKVFEGAGTAENRARYIERVRPAEWERWLKRLASDAGYQRFALGEAKMVTMGRSTQAQVLWDVDYLISRWGPGWKLASVTPEAYGHQTGVLLIRQ